MNMFYEVKCDIMFALGIFIGAAGMLGTGLLIQLIINHKKEKQAKTVSFSDEFINRLP